MRNKIKSIFFLLELLLYSCRSVPKESKTTIIQKDTVIYTTAVKLDTTLVELSDTIFRRNLTLAYSIDTIKQKVKVFVQTKPETIRVPQIKTIIKERTKIKHSKVSSGDKSKKRGPPIWIVGGISGLVSAGIVLLFTNLKRLIKLMFNIPL